MMRILLALITVLFLVGSFTHASTASPTEAATPTATPAIPALHDAIMNNRLRVDGSTTAIPLQRLIVCTILRIPCTWVDEFWGNGARMIVPDPAANIDPKREQRIREIQFTTTPTAYLNLIDGKTDCILVARLPSPDELAAASTKGVVLEAKAIALDAFVFIVNSRNPLANLSIDQIRSIYSGKTTTWKELGVVIDPGSKEPEKIHPYQRQQNSGSQELMESLIMKGTPMIAAPDLMVETMIGPFNVLGGNDFQENQGDVLGLGYSVYYYTAYIYPHIFVKMVPIGDVPPTPQTIAARTYPLTAEVYAVVRAKMPPNSVALLFRDWLLSAAGQQIIKQSGYVPIQAGE